MKVGQTLLMNSLQQKMQWLQKRYNLVAENIANARVEGYKPKDLSQFKVGENARIITEEGSVILTKEMTKGAETRQAHSFVVSVYGRYISMINKYVGKMRG